jgi:hypothetical protein
MVRNHSAFLCSLRPHENPSTMVQTLRQELVPGWETFPPIKVRIICTQTCKWCPTAV